MRRVDIIIVIFVIDQHACFSNNIILSDVSFFKLETAILYYIVIVIYRVCLSPGNVSNTAAVGALRAETIYYSTRPQPVDH